MSFQILKKSGFTYKILMNFIDSAIIKDIFPNTDLPTL